ncbi:ABC transporter substrate-binding protein [Bordetella genomosp. 10]|nr:ABC transporter substrate-binding protein [Bordetella genomosp. 10]
MSSSWFRCAARHTLAPMLALLPVLAAAQANPVSFRDMLGNTVTLAGPAQRAVTLPMPAGSLLMSLDRGPAHLAGMHPNAHTYLARSVLAKAFPASVSVRADITRSGFAPNIETLLEIRPDIVWQWGHMGDELLAPLRDAGLTAAALVYGSEDRTREWIRIIGHSLGQDARARAQLQWRDTVHAEIARATGALRADQRPGVLYLSRYAPQYRTAGAGTNFEHDVALAGGRNVAAAVAGAQAVNIEQIMAWAPDVILVGNFDPGLTPRVLYDDPLFAGLPAVRNHRVYQIPAGGYLWDPPSQESPLYWQWLGLLLHPELFDWPLRERIVQAYGELYGYTPDAGDIDRILRVRDNQEARGYDRLR